MTTGWCPGRLSGLGRFLKLWSQDEARMFTMVLSTTIMNIAAKESLTPREARASQERTVAKAGQRIV
jgi:hypothetical protein